MYYHGTKPLSILTANSLIEQLSTLIAGAVQLALQVALPHPAELLDALEHRAVQALVVRTTRGEHHRGESGRQMEPMLLATIQYGSLVYVKKNMLTPIVFFCMSTMYHCLGKCFAIKKQHNKFFIFILISIEYLNQ